jgi:hypothetical protein
MQKSYHNARIEQWMKTWQHYDILIRTQYITDATMQQLMLSHGFRLIHPMPLPKTNFHPALLPLPLKLNFHKSIWSLPVRWLVHARPLLSMATVTQTYRKFPTCHVYLQLHDLLVRTQLPRTAAFTSITLNEIIYKIRIQILLDLRWLEHWTLAKRSMNMRFYIVLFVANTI